MSTEDTSRRQKVVMALGIATIILFSANLLTVLANHFLPDHDVPFLSRQEAVTAEAPPDAYEVHVHSYRDTHRHEHRFVVEAPTGTAAFHLGEWDPGKLDLEIAELEAAARRFERELSLEMQELSSLRFRVRTVDS